MPLLAKHTRASRFLHAAAPAGRRLEDYLLSAHSQRVIALAILAVAAGLALAIYSQAFSSAFYGDDYRYMLASRDMSWAHFLRDAFYPWADPERSTVAGDHWRPLSWLLFRVQYHLFGDEPTGYHLVSFAFHLAGIVMVWLLALRLIRGTIAPLVATVVFAIHPAGFETVTWISALSFAGLPIALAGWLVFVSAVEAKTPRHRWQMHALALALIAVAFLNRETSIVVLPAMGAWYLLDRCRDRLLEPRTYLPLVPYAVLLAVYVLVATWFFTVRSDQQLSVDQGAVERGWFYVRQALLPIGMERYGAPLWVQRALGLAVLAIPFAALAARRWLLLALSLGFLASIVPYALFSVGYGPRYFYFPTAFLALALGAVAAELWPVLTRLAGARPAAVTVAAGLSVAVLAVTVFAYQRVEQWKETTPDVQEQWVKDLRRIHPELPDGGVLYVTNVPFQMGLLLGFVVQPTVDYLYPEGTHRVQIFYRVNLEDVRPYIGPNDRLFVFGEQ